MAAVDPTYPLYPIACIISAAMLLLVLLTSFIRLNWNLGVVFLCFWLLVECLTAGIEAIIWSDNDNIRLYVFCDIVSHLQMVTSIVKPMATLIIARRLYFITTLQSVELPSRAAKLRNLAVEWTLGLIIPLIVAGPLYYVVQWPRFQVVEGFGCTNSTDDSILCLLLVNSWDVIPPLVSIMFYYPRVAHTFYRQNRDVNHFLQSNGSISRTNYIRILVLASIDILFTMPVGVVNTVLIIRQILSFDSLSLYYGWTYDHTDWEPVAYTYASMAAQGNYTLGRIYFMHWTSPALAFVIFGLFGVNSEARASYWRLLCAIGGWFGWTPTLRMHGARSQMEDIEFGKRSPQDSMSQGFQSQPKFICPNASTQEEPSKDVSLISETESRSERHCRASTSRLQRQSA